MLTHFEAYIGHQETQVFTFQVIPMLLVGHHHIIISARYSNLRSGHHYSDAYHASGHHHEYEHHTGTKFFSLSYHQHHEHYIDIIIHIIFS